MYMSVYFRPTLLRNGLSLTFRHAPDGFSTLSRNVSDPEGVIRQLRLKKITWRN